MTPMIDIVFQLLTFFMIAINFGEPPRLMSASSSRSIHSPSRRKQNSTMS